MTNDPSNILRNYRALIARVDELCQRIGKQYRSEIACRRGCADCCRHLSLFPVEARALADALAERAPEQIDQIRRRAREAAPDGSCPLLDKGECLLYEARPLICRTHGLPLLTSTGDAFSVDFCPLNFRATASLPGSAVIQLDRLNEALAAIDALFTKEAGEPDRRVTVAEALLPPGEHPRAAATEADAHPGSAGKPMLR